MDPYKILDVNRNATRDEIQRAYRRQATKHHPDAGGDAWVFQQVQAAYEQLTTSPSGTNESGATDENGVRHPASPETDATYDQEQLDEYQGLGILIGVVITCIGTILCVLWSAFWPESIVVKEGFFWDTKKDLVRFHFVFFLLRLLWTVPLSILVGGVIGYSVADALTKQTR